MIALVWTERAIRDLRRQIAYVAQFDPAAADRIGDLVEARARWLCDTPLGGQILPGKRLRHFRVRGTSRILVYRTGSSTLSIAGIVHTKQNWR